MPQQRYAEQNIDQAGIDKVLDTVNGYWKTDLSKTAVGKLLVEEFGLDAIYFDWAKQCVLDPRYKDHYAMGLIRMNIDWESFKKYNGNAEKCFMESKVIQQAVAAFKQEKTQSGCPLRFVESSAGAALAQYINAILRPYGYILPTNNQIPIMEYAHHHREVVEELGVSHVKDGGGMRVDERASKRGFFRRRLSLPALMGKTDEGRPSA